MVGISKDNLCPNFNQIVRRTRLDGPAGANGHKNWSIDNAVRCSQFPDSGLRLRICVDKCEFVVCH